MRLSPARILFVLAVTALASACQNESVDPTSAEETYGAAVITTDAVPAPAVAAEPDRYLGRRITVDGRLLAVGDDGCTLDLDTDGGPALRMVSPRATDDSCAWQVPADQQGVAAASGTLRVRDDTLRLSANGVQVTPVQKVDSDS